MKLLINYANGIFQESQRRNSATGCSIAGFDRAISYGPGDIDAAFRQKNKQILSAPQGNGYWLWKPYFIEKSLRQLADGELLFYCDSGSHFIDSLAPLFAIPERDDQDVICFELGLVEKDWTKRDAFLLLNCDSREFTHTPQRLGGFSLWRKSSRSLEVARQWLEYAQDPRLITDLKNQLGKYNYQGFRAHRHDQSLFSLVTKKRGIVPHRDPSQWGNGGMDSYPHSTYGQLIDLTRKRGRLPLLPRIAKETGRLAKQIIKLWPTRPEPLEAA